MFKWLIGGDDDDDHLDKIKKKTGIHDVEDQDTLDDYVSDLIDIEESRDNN